MKTSIIVLYFFISILTIRFTPGQTTNDNASDYIPLAVGNKWYYANYGINSNANTDTAEIFEIFGKDYINNKEYYKFYVKRMNPKLRDYYFYQRVSSDTLFTLNFDQKSRFYNETISAIFSLDTGYVKQIELPHNELSLRNLGEGLPNGRHYALEVINRNENTIEIYTHSRMIDGDYRQIFKKDIGMIRTVSSWGVGLELIDYDFSK